MEALKEALENKKALLIALAAAFGMIVVAVAVTLIIRGRSAERFSNDDVPYPYAWVEKRDGSITMTLESGKAKNSAWSVESTQGVSTEVTVGKTGGKKTSVTITPVEEGPERVTFVLTSGEERLAELAVTASVENVDERFVTHIISSRERAMQGAVHGGEETGHAFTVRADDEGLTAIIANSRSRAKQLAKILAGTAVQQVSDDGRLPSEGVALLDVKLAKGLEFDQVIIPDVQDGAFPDEPIRRHRLYTAISRATKRVTLVANGRLTGLLR